jgi:hypothetical protein
MNTINSSAVGAFRCPACEEWHMEGESIWVPWINPDGSAVCYYNVAVPCTQAILAKDQEGHDKDMETIRDRLVQWYPELSERIESYTQDLFAKIRSQLTR